MNKILSYLKSTPRSSLIYAAVSVCALAMVVFVFGWMLVFLVRTIDSLIIGEGEEGAIPFSAFNLADFALLSKKLNINFAPVVTSTATSTAVSAATSTENASPLTPTEKRSPLTLKILNGTTKSGLAKLWQEKFASASFENITIGNAKRTNYTGAYILYKPDKAEDLPSLKKVLIDGGIREESIKEEGDKEIEEDFVVVIGK